MQEKFYNNIYAYKSDMNAIGDCAVFIVFLCFSLFLSLYIDLYYLIAVGFCSAIWIFTLLRYIKYKQTPDLIIVQKNEELYFFPETDKQFVVPLKDIAEIKKKNYRSRYGGKSPDGKLIIITKDNIYKFSISRLDLIFSRINNNIKLFKDC